MKRSIVVIVLVLLMIFSSCGTDSKTAELPEPTIADSATPTNSENNSSNLESIESFLSLVNSSEDMKAEYNAESNALYVDFSLPATFDELTAYSSTIRDELSSLIENLNELNEALYAHMLNNNINNVYLYFDVLDSEGRSVAFYMNEEPAYNYFAYELENYE